MKSSISYPDNSCVTPREVAASYSRYSSYSRREEGNIDQQQKCREKAETNEHQISPELKAKKLELAHSTSRKSG
jgi:hypothetical protein